MSESNKPLADEQRHKDMIEGVKAVYDFFKHMTTLSTGSLLLLATLLEKFFKAPSWTALIGLTFVGFIVSLVSSLVMMFLVSVFIARSGETEESVNIIANIGALGAAGGFLCGIGALITFSLRNFYS